MTQGPDERSAQPSGTQPAGEAALAFEDWESAEIGPAELADVFTALDKAARARRLYQSNNPVYQGFHTNLRNAFARLWDRIQTLHVVVEEHGFRCMGDEFKAGEGRDSLPFLFYKDGVRVLSFLPGFEDEAEAFLDVVTRARLLDQNATDDMVTLLWEQEFTAFQYNYVDLLAEGLQIPQAGGYAPRRIDPARIAADAAAPVEEEAEPAAVQAGQPSVAEVVSREGFNETLYFLESDELERLGDELELEWRRDVRSAVLDALFDRLEDAGPERQIQILRILRQLLPVFLGRGDLANAARVLEELTVAMDAGVLGERIAEARDLFRELSDPAVLGQLLRSLEDGTIDPAGQHLAVFLSHLGAGSLPLLIHATETTELAALRQRLRSAIEGLGREHRAYTVQLIRSEDAAVAVGAARLAGQLGLTEAAPEIAVLLKRGAVGARRVAVESLVQLRTSIALGPVLDAIADEDREVRIAAARGLGSVRYQPARARLEALVQEKELRDSDLTEQIAVFEALGAVAIPETVRMLEKLLKGRRLLGKQSPEIRACAAMALGRVGSDEARAALRSAADDPHPMVRSAVSKALAEDGAER